MITGPVVAVSLSPPSSDAVDQDGDSSLFFISAGVLATVVGVSGELDR